MTTLDTPMATVGDDWEGITEEWAIWEGASSGLIRRIDGRRYMAVKPFMYTHAVIWGFIGDNFGFEDRWCYDDLVSALIAATNWDGEGEPTGWHRHPRSGRRRPGGDPSKEYVNP